MEKIRYATKEDALKIAIVNVYTWKTQYSGLMPEEVIDERVNTVTQMAEKIKARMDEDNKCIVLDMENLETKNIKIVEKFMLYIC